MRELARLRRAIDALDDAMVAAAATRRALVRRVAMAKSRAGVAAVDPGREHAVHARAARLAARLGLPPATARRLMDALIADARAVQGVGPDPDQGARPAAARMIAPAMRPVPDRSARWLRLVPPPSRLAPLTRRLPARWQAPVLERVVARALAAPLADGLLDFMQGRRIGIDVTDLGLGWTFELQGRRLAVVDADPEARVRGTATDLLRLAARLDDADTLFFQRRLVLTGDTELGLTARNVLDRLPWETVPLALRIVLHRAARLAAAARDAHHEGRAA